MNEIQTDTATDMVPEINDADFGGTVNSSPERAAEFKLSQPDQDKGQSETIFTAKILPALPAYRDKKSGFKYNGKWVEFNWAFFHQVHWGYKTIGDDGQLRATPFVCPRKYHYGKLVDDCQECIDIKAKKTAREGIESKYKLKYGEDKDAIKAALKDDTAYQEIAAWLKIHSLERRWHVNVMTLDGQIGKLKLSKTTFETELYPLLKNNEEEGSFDINGGFYTRFVTTGNSLEKVDKASVYTRKEEATIGKKVQMVDVPVSAGLTQAQKGRVLALAPDISDVRAVKVTSSVVNQLTKAEGDPEVNTRLLKPAKGE